MASLWSTPKGVSTGRIFSKAVFAMNISEINMQF